MFAHFLIMYYRMTEKFEKIFCVFQNKQCNKEYIQDWWT